MAFMVFIDVHMCAAAKLHNLQKHVGDLSHQKQRIAQK
jgi:hypothetical protein